MSFRRFIVQDVGKLIPDKLWIEIKYLQWFHKLPNLKNPKTFNEKLNWLKLHDHNPEYTTMVDKYEAKKYIADRIGEQYVIPVVGGPWQSFDEIDFDELPNQFVLKTTHDCGGVVICKDKNVFNRSKACAFLTDHLKTNYFLTGREWPYRSVKPRIFAEAYIHDICCDHMNNHINEQLTDYKFFCFDGETKVLYVATDRVNSSTETKFDFYDMEFNHLPIVQGHPNSDNLIGCPSGFSLMKELAAILSHGLPQIRVDFYSVGANVYVGELTLSHFSGLVPFKPESWDYKLGEWITLPQRDDDDED